MTISRVSQLVGQMIAYGVFAAFIGYLSVSPRYLNHEPGMAAITLSFSHAGEPESECHRMTQAELEQLAPNMRRPMQCPRRRVPLHIELELDGEPTYEATLEPSGLSGDGVSTAYHRISVSPGSHQLVIRLRDTRRKQGFDWYFSDTIDIAERQHLIVDFRPNTGGFQIL